MKDPGATRSCGRNRTRGLQRWPPARGSEGWHRGGGDGGHRAGRGGSSRSRFTPSLILAPGLQGAGG